MFLVLQKKFNLQSLRLAFFSKLRGKGMNFAAPSLMLLPANLLIWFWHVPSIPMAQVGSVHWELLSAGMRIHFLGMEFSSTAKVYSGPFALKALACFIYWYRCSLKPTNDTEQQYHTQHTVGYLSTKRNRDIWLNNSIQKKNVFLRKKKS